MKYTPGPWYAIYRPSMHAPGVHIRSHLSTLEIGYCNSEKSRRAEFDARLLSAAPELLAACVAMKNSTDFSVEDTSHLDQTTLEAMKMMEEAILKAEGAK